MYSRSCRSLSPHPFSAAYCTTSWYCAPSSRMRSTSSTRLATSAASDFGFFPALFVSTFFFLAMVGPHQFVDPGGVPVVQPAVPEGGQLLAVLVGPQVGAALEDQRVAFSQVEADHLAVA